ncbi:MAG: 4Fe-4S binding protein [Coriobacteriia bacterium]|nr:4Fe-4S binding protein [Coriobacteriia bacterium]
MGRLLRLQPDRPDLAAHGYVYYRWTQRYVAIVRWALARPWLGPFRRATGEHLAKTHHAKVVPADEARRVITLNQPIELRALEHVVPFETARDVVLEAPVKIALAQCACRGAAEAAGDRDGHCGPLEQCLYLGDEIASFVVEKQSTARFITADEALGVIESASERGSIHTLWFKDAAGGRMYAICNCCSCCCIGLKAERAGFSPLAGSGHLARLDAAACTACGACVPTCAFGALALPDDATRVAIDPERCYGCGACVGACPSDALRLQRAEETGVEPVPWSARP